MEPLREDSRKTKRGQSQASLERSDGELGLQEVVSRELRLNSVSQFPLFPGGHRRWYPSVVVITL